MRQRYMFTRLETPFREYHCILQLREARVARFLSCITENYLHVTERIICITENYLHATERMICTTENYLHVTERTIVSWSCWRREWHGWNVQLSSAPL